MGRVFIVCGGRTYDDRELVFDVLDRLHDESPITAILHGACGQKIGPQHMFREVVERQHDGSLVEIHHLRRVVLGKMKGADGHAEAWAVDRKVRTYTFPADWDRYSTGAGPKRNREMLVAGHKDHKGLQGLIAFPGRDGTEGMKDLAREFSLRVGQIDSWGAGRSPVLRWDVPF